MEALIDLVADLPDFLDPLLDPLQFALRAYPWAYTCLLAVLASAYSVVSFGAIFTAALLSPRAAETFITPLLILATGVLASRTIWKACTNVHRIAWFLLKWSILLVSIGTIVAHGLSVQRATSDRSVYAALNEIVRGAVANHERELYGDWIVNSLEFARRKAKSAGRLHGYHAHGAHF